MSFRFENRSKKKRKKNEKKNTKKKLRLFAILGFCQIGFKSEKNRQESKAKTKKTIGKNEQTQNKLKIHRKKKENRVFFATISGVCLI
jgi:hypothetical protein